MTPELVFFQAGFVESAFQAMLTDHELAHALETILESLQGNVSNLRRILLMI